MPNILARFSAGAFLLLLSLTSASLFAQPIDQAGWAQRKQQVRLPNGVTLAYVEMGDPKGEPVLLLHGYTDTSRVWTALAPQLMKYRLLIPDQRGHGASSKPACCYALSNLAHDAVLFLNAKGVKRAHVVGHSLGSMIAQLMAAEYPDRVGKIVLAGSTGLAPIQRGDWIWEQVMALEQPIASNTAFLKDWTASPTPVEPTLMAWSTRDIEAVPMHVWRAIPRELAGNEFTRRHAPDIKAPTLILSAEKDTLFDRSHHDALAKAIPQAEAVIVPEVGHNLILERTEIVGPAVVGFLGR